MTSFHRSVAFVLSVTIAIDGVSAASGTPTSQVDVKVSSLILQLGSADRADRVSAEQELTNRGPEILGQFPGPEEVTDPAVRAAVERIRKQIELNRAAQVWKAGRLTLDDVDSLAEHVSLTFEQSERTGGLSQETGTYWQVIEQVSRKIDGWPDRVLPDGQMTFRERTPSDARKRVTTAGPFRIEGGPIEVKPIAGGSTNQLVRVPMTLRTEPRIRPLFGEIAAKNVQLTLSDGSELSPFTPAAQYELPFGNRGGTAALRLDFLSTGKLAESLTLAGSVTMTVAAGEERFAFPLDEITRSPAETSRGSVRVRVQQASRKEDGTAAVEMAVVYDRGGPAFESYRTWVYHNQADLNYTTGSEAEPVQHRLAHEPAFSTLAQADGGLVLAYRFAGLPADARQIEFVYEAPTSILEAPIEFRIEGLPVTLSAESDADR